MEKNTDQDLLFGVFALQLERITQEQMSKAYAEWLARQDSSMASLMVEHGWVSEDDRLEIEQLIESHQQTQTDGIHETASGTMSTELLDSLPEELTSQLTEALTEFTTSQESQPTPTETVELSTVLQPIDGRDRYSLLRIQGEGGLGRVWVAKDRTLGRDVALKEIRDADEATADAIARFQREARITSRLEHPNIVPVYDLKANNDGDSLFYTMRLVHGHTLGDAIKQYHTQKQQGRDTRLKLQELLAAFMGVCQAVGYAHAKGVIHRDIKPANVLLGEFGEVILLDWGLARFRHEDEHCHSPGSVQADAAALETQSGNILGTPAYMAPEQARGDIAALDHRTDIYSLGAMLFTICTGQSPHRGQTTQEVLRYILGPETPSPRDLDASVPRALDAICRKALAKRKEDRYASALQLRDDVTRWLADEPVSVHSETWAEKCSRRFRRHKTLTLSTLAALSGIAVIAIIAALLINRARLREADALAAEQAARGREQLAQEASHQCQKMALDAISKWQVDLSDLMKHHPRVQAIRERLLEQAAQEYRNLKPEVQEQPVALEEYIRIHLRLGDVRMQLEKPQPALAAYSIAEEQLVQLVESVEEPDHDVMQLAKCQAAKASALAKLGKFEDAENTFQTARNTLKQVKSQSPGSIDYVETLAQVCFEHGQFLIDRHRWDDAEKPLQEGLEFAGFDVDTSWELPIVKYRADILQALSRVSAGRTQFTESLGLLEKSLPLWTYLRKRKLEAEEMEDPAALEGLANTHVLRAYVSRLMGQSQQEVANYELAAKDYEALKIAYPEIPHYRYQLCVANLNLAQVKAQNGEIAEALPIVEEAFQSANQLWQISPKNPQYQALEASARGSYGQILRELNQLDLAMLAFEDAAARRKDLLKDQPKHAGYRLHLATSLMNLSQVLAQRGDVPGSEEPYQEGLKLLQELSQNPDESQRAQFVLAVAQARLADVLWKQKEKPKASDLYRQSLALFEKLDSTPDQRFEWAWLLAFAFDPELQNSQRAYEISKELAESYPENGRYLALLGATLVQTGKHPQAISTLKSATQLMGGNTAITWFHLALAHQATDNSKDSQTAYQTGLAKMLGNQKGNVLLQHLQATHEPMFAQPSASQ